MELTFECKKAKSTGGHTINNGTEQQSPCDTQIPR